jgi:hypothetical protein
MSEILKLASDAVELSLGAGVEKAMNKYNNRSTIVEIPEKEEVKTDLGRAEEKY